MPKLVLFDIDGTLVLTGGAGIRAMNRAGATLLAAPSLLDGVEVAGRTDSIILHDALRILGRQLDDELFRSLRELYLLNLREEILEPGEGLRGVLPGVPELLAVMQGREGLVAGLVTGNLAEGARIKLEHFGLWDLFRCGAFGDDDPDRNALVPYAVRRADECGIGRVPYEDVVVVGDTPHDVACARAVGAMAIAVATGSYSSDRLQATGADVVLEDLSDTDGFLRLITAG